MMIYVKLLIFLLFTTFAFSDSTVIGKKSAKETHERSISKKPCHDISVTPYMLKKIDNNQGYEYSFNKSPLYLILKILLAVAIITFRNRLSSLPFVHEFSLLLFVPLFLLYSVFLEWNIIKQDEKLVFDTHNRVYYQQANQKDKELKYYTSFDNIKAIQLLIYKECWGGGGQSGGTQICDDAYELNLVFDNNHRINLETHKEYFRMYHNALILKKILNKPMVEDRYNKRPDFKSKKSNFSLLK